ncbi:PPOX class F420-dependent oxidoreductase [Candidatus Protofrankia californiensis]|uniref:PPOX class F420-dependent oxidoreductase n=1 Tax=Candidatus Protofrankia californiensis TaxID=1839754 RepID=UPI00104116AB|nr:PPOX class F420-dependent oxidoreductase [Candidatus Protofrankia californiensis]
MASMTQREWRTFLAAGKRTGKLATVRRDGRPHVAPVWFVLDGEEVVFTTGAASVKGRALRRDGRASLCVDDEKPPYSFVLVEGSVTVSEDPTELLRWATTIAGRYIGADRAEEFGRRNGVPGELLVRLSLTKVIAQRDIADQ